MALHATSGRARLGVALAATTMLAWATLPVALSVLLARIDPLTLCWFRFCVAATLLALWLRRQRALPRLGDLTRVEWALLAAATLGLASNYVLFLLGLEMTTPANVQILMQTSPLLLALGGIAIFGERFTRTQWIGFGTLLAGLALFFTDQLGSFVAQGRAYLPGSAVLFAASATWAGYGLAQKQMLTRLSSQQLLLCITAGCALCLTPLSTPAALLGMPPLHAALLAYCSLNTVVAYGAFTASMEHLEASRVGAILALTPVATFTLIAATHAAFPGLLPAEHFSAPMLAGAGAVVVGSTLTSRG